VKKFPIALLVTLLITITNGFASQIIEANGMIFSTDQQAPTLSCGESAVFPYSDEAAVLLEIASKIKESRGKEFSIVIDPFCGDGKSGLPIVFHQIAEKLQGSDLNIRAIQYAKENAQLNHLKTKSCFSVRDIIKEGLVSSDSPGNTLWIANPPFALKAKGSDLELMRDGGENGLRLTIAFAGQALAISQPGDVILGIGYSRIRTNSSLELEEELNRAIANHGGTLEVILLEGQKLWRDYQGNKQQNNPMPITEEIFALKADPSNPEESNAYRTAAQFHNKAGFNKLGYYAYIIYKGY